jgi:hypothetical protein
LHFSTMLLYPKCISQSLDRQDTHIVTVRLLDQDFMKRGITLSLLIHAEIHSAALMSSHY